MSTAVPTDAPTPEYSPIVAYITEHLVFCYFVILALAVLIWTYAAFTAALVDRRWTLDPVQAAILEGYHRWHKATRIRGLLT